jgi:hypothetical protein
LKAQLKIVNFEYSILFTWRKVGDRPNILVEDNLHTDRARFEGELQKLPGEIWQTKERFLKW